MQNRDDGEVARRITVIEKWLRRLESMIIRPTGSGTLHNEVTVTDTATISLTLLGQALTADLIPAGISHSTLADLDYASAGHTGFQAALTLPLVVGQGGTGVSTLADGGLVVGNAAGAVEVIAAGLTTQILVGGGALTNPAWGTDLPTAVTIGTKYIYRADGTDVPVVDGGTGASTFALNGVLYGNAANALGVTAIGAQYKVLTVGGTPFVPVFSSYLLDGTSGGKTSLAVTSGKTLTLTAVDDYNVTIPSTGTIQMRSNSFRNELFTKLISPMLEALTWTAAQIFQASVTFETLATVIFKAAVTFQSTAAATFQSTIAQAVTSSGAGSTFNQSGTGDIAAFQDASTATVRVLDQGGIALVPQAGGFQSVAGLLGYDSVKKRLVLYHETHNYPVPIDPRNTCRNKIFTTTY